MHEMGIALQIVQIAAASIPVEMKGAKVLGVKIKVGKLAAVVPDSLRFCFEIVTQETPLSEARLEIEEIPVVARCKHCHSSWEIKEPAFACPSCGSGSIEILSGRELDIDSIEIEEPEHLNHSGNV
ncbi:MAG: hydrogenase maturation nickel metallochaperone HypA [Deltaproteobacteria bacterium RBG_13_49_15]|nr:MAG: hydrogenase maturation nickel metallochaperone HypA [Deltaproteobacteria bacterium RBG_13_49_15]